METVKPILLDETGQKMANALDKIALHDEGAYQSALSAEKAAQHSAESSQIAQEQVELARTEATKAKVAAQSVENKVGEIKAAIEELPDGQAVTAKVAELGLKTGKFSASLGDYDGVGEKTMSVNVPGKAIGTDGKEFTKAGYAISGKISVNRGDILVFPSSQVLPTDVSFFNRAVTRTYQKIDHYEYEYDDDGNVTKETPVFVEVTESFYEALSAQSVAAMPTTGYVYLCPTTMEIVVCGIEADIREKKLQVFGLGIFKNMATNFVGAPGQRIIAQMFLQQQAEIDALKSMIDNLGALRCRSLSVDDMPMVCGSPLVLFGHGVPADGNVPDNWNADMGEWNGCPCFVGQNYIDLDASANGVYYANGTDAVFNWKQA